MSQNCKNPLFEIIIILFIISGALQACSPVAVDSASLISTPARDEYTEAFITYVRQLEHDGLATAKEIRVEDSQPFIFILKPQSKEIADEDVKNVTELALRTVSVFDSAGGLKHDDIDIAFHRPTEQKILLIKRRNMPELLSADIYGEVTISIRNLQMHGLLSRQSVLLMQEILRIVTQFATLFQPTPQLGGLEWMGNQRQTSSTAMV